MITINKMILLIILYVVYLDPNRYLVLCDNWILNWTDHFSNNQINSDIWRFNKEEIGKSYGKTDQVSQPL